jgi:hypothetical protein
MKNFLRPILLFVFTAVSIVAFLAWQNSAHVLPAASAPQGVVYHPIPPGFDFPADQNALLQLRDTQNVSAIRKHAWMVFAGLTQPTPSGEAVWETWFSEDQAFSSGPVPQGLAPHRVQRRFRNPRQFGAVDRSALPQAVGASLLSFVLFNKDSFDHIRSNRFYQRTKLDQINQAFNTNQTPIEKREISPFPREAVSIKTVWSLVKQTGITAMPIWDGTPSRPDQQGNPPPTWPRFVGVDPTRTQIPPDERRDVMFQGQVKANSHIVPLNNFYSFQISQNEITDIRRVSGFQQAQVGDFAALVAMHVTTKEIPDWVWATFWWHDDPNTGTFANDRPAAVAGVWRNYLMDTTLSGDIPKAGDGGSNVCFNPWLEARFSGGLVSNCLTCHRRSVWTSVPFLPISRGRLPDDDQFFAGKTKLDFLWSIALLSR